MALPRIVCCDARRARSDPEPATVLTPFAAALDAKKRMVLDALVRELEAGATR